MRNVMKLGVDVAGGMPFNEASPADSCRHIEIVFDIAKEFSADIEVDCRTYRHAPALLR